MKLYNKFYNFISWLSYYFTFIFPSYNSKSITTYLSRQASEKITALKNRFFIFPSIFLILGQKTEFLENWFFHYPVGCFYKQQKNLMISPCFCDLARLRPYVAGANWRPFSKNAILKIVFYFFIEFSNFGTKKQNF